MIEIIGAILTALLASPLLKKKPWVIWIMKATGKWESPNASGNSYRRCMKAVKVLIDNGTPSQSIIILPKGVTPPGPKG